MTRKISKKLADLRTRIDIVRFGIRECRKGTYGLWAQKHWVKVAIFTWQSKGDFPKAWRNRQVQLGHVAE